MSNLLDEVNSSLSAIARAEQTLGAVADCIEQEGCKVEMVYYVAELARPDGEMAFGLSASSGLRWVALVEDANGHFWLTWRDASGAVGARRLCEEDSMDTLATHCLEILRERQPAAAKLRLH
ncbi:MAG: hypothetical protein RJA63_1774 [Pseudomonadota bacterium]